MFETDEDVLAEMIHGFQTLKLDVELKGPLQRLRPLRIARINREIPTALHAHSESTAMIGDRMDTDVVAGLEAGLETVLVLTGVSSREDVEKFPFRPTRIADSIADLLDDVPPPTI